MGVRLMAFGQRYDVDREGTHGEFVGDETGRRIDADFEYRRCQTVELLVDEPHRPEGLKRVEAFPVLVDDLAGEQWQITSGAAAGDQICCMFGIDFDSMEQLGCRDQECMSSVGGGGRIQSSSGFLLD